MKSLRSVQKEVRRLAALIHAGPKLLPTFGHSEDFARPHIEVNELGYHYVVIERGTEFSRYTTGDFDALLYEIFNDITHQLATTYELAHRVERKDTRRAWFPLQVELLKKLSDDWGLRRAAELQAILHDHPFDDVSCERATLTKQLREQGQSPEVAWQMACEQFPFLRISSEVPGEESIP